MSAAPCTHMPAWGAMHALGPTAGHGRGTAPAPPPPPPRPPYRQEVCKQLPARLLLVLVGSGSQDALAHTLAALLVLSTLQPALLPLELLPTLLGLLTHETQGMSCWWCRLIILQ